MFRKISLIVAFVAMAFSLVASPAMAAVTFDSTTGTGSVGLGDLMGIFRLKNNQAAQTWYQSTGSFSFVYSDQATYQVTCEWETGNPDNPKSVNTHEITTPRHRNVNATVDFTARGQSNFAGFTLNGYDQYSETGQAIPEVGDSCLSQSGNPNSAIGTVIDVSDPVGTGGVLTLNGTSIWP